MPNLSAAELGQLILRKRGSMGIRAAADEIGISSATLSRIERGHVADVKRMNKIFAWLGLDPREFFGYKSPGDNGAPAVQIAFKNTQTLKPETLQALAELILIAQRSFEEKVHAESH